MNFRNLIVILFLFFYFNSNAAKSIISGFAPGAENLNVRLYTKDDYISNKERLIANVLIDSLGHFKIELNVYEKQIITAYFRIMDFSSGEIYIPANKTYELKFDSFDYKDPNRINVSMLSTAQLYFKITNVDSLDINQIISDFNRDFSACIIELSGISKNTSSYSFIRPQKNKVDETILSISEKYSKINNEFFKNYVEYSLALLQLNTQSKSRIYLFDKYIYKRPILYDNIAYMDFLSNYFSDFIFGVSKKIQPYDIVSNINIKPNLNGLIDSLGKDSMLRNEQLREMVMLMNMREWYSYKAINQDSLIKVLSLYATKTKFDIQSKIAKNLIYMLTRFNKGNELPLFKFKSIDGDVFTNDSLKNKYTFLLFFTTWSKPCLSELLVLNELQKKWGDSIRFVGVAMDWEPLKLYYFLEDNKFNFDIYHFDNDWVLAENLGLVSFPHGIFIDKNGKIIEYFSPSPSKGLFELFQKTIEGKTNSKN